MTERLFTVHFGYSRSPRYAQAVELANRCPRHLVSGEGHNVWHRVTFSEDEVDLMASLYLLVRGFSGPRFRDTSPGKVCSYLKHGHYDYVYDTPGQRRRVSEVGEQLKAEHGGNATAALAALREDILDPIATDSKAVMDLLLAKGYLACISDTNPRGEPPKRPREHHAGYAAVHEAIDHGQLEQAVSLYYQALGDRPFGELHPELLYLKRLVGIPLLGRDILAFRTESTWTDLVKAHIEEYCTCIDEAVQRATAAGRESPLEILRAGVPTLTELIERTQRKYNRAACVWDPPYNAVHVDHAVVTVDNFGEFTCPKGRLFERYVNPLVYHWFGDEMQEYVFEKGVWTIVSPEFVEREVLAKDLTLAGIAAWKPTRRRSAIKSFEDISQVELGQYAVSGIRYTGRVHRLGDVSLYEADLLRNDIPKFGVGSRVQDWAEEILREAENLLRERHGLPRIGEGWIAETLLLGLVREVFPDAIQHSAPPWLAPQHLDIYVPTANLAVEYQGQQHFEPVDFFGGTTGFSATKTRDERKRKKCASRGIRLIYWNYDEPITRDRLVAKLGELKAAAKAGGRHKSRTPPELPAQFGACPIETVRAACLAALPDTPDLAGLVAAWIVDAASADDPPPLTAAQIRRVTAALEARVM